MSKVTLPYIPAPFEDEVLGSWLSRCAILSGAGAWKATLVESGLDRKLQSPTFNLVDFSPQFDTLLHNLGTEYEQALLDLTTATFWCTFSGHHDIKIPGTKNMPMPTTSRGHPCSKISGMNLSFSLRSGLKPWYCPICIGEDFRREGETYWRKSHQIPTILYCPHHWIPLQNRCPSCGAINGRKGKGILPTPALRCQCGFDLRTASKVNAPVAASYKRLCNLSKESLILANSCWSASSLRKLISSKADEFTSSHSVTLPRAIQDQFPGCIIVNKKITLAPEGVNRKTCVFNFADRCSAPNTALLLALLDIPLAEAIESSQTFEPHHKEEFGVRAISKQTSEINVHYARLKFTDRASVGDRSALHNFYYWYLRIHDESWLKHEVEKYFQGTHNQARLPSIVEDRELILSKSQRKNFKYSSIHRKYECLRARVRDREWLDSLKEVHRPQRRRTRNSLFEARTLELSAHLAKMLSDEVKPLRITIGDLANRCGITYSQAMLRINADDKLRHTFREANRTKNERLLVWAANELEKEGTFLTTSLIFKRAGLPSTTDTLKLVRKLVEDAHSRLIVSPVSMKTKKNNAMKHELTLALPSNRSKYPSDISQDQFEQIRDRLEGARKRTCPKTYHSYDIFCAILYVLETDCSWRAIPKDFPPSAMVKHHFYNWNTTLAPNDQSLLEHTVAKSKKGKSVKQWKELLNNLQHRGRKNSRSWKASRPTDRSFPFSPLEANEPNIKKFEGSN